MSDLCTLEDVKDALGITDTRQDSQLERLISAASIEILREMRRPDLTPDAEYSDRLCGDGSCEIFLKHWPVNSISLVKIYGEEISESDGTSCGWFFDDSVDSENRQKLYLIGMYFPHSCYQGCGHRHHIPNVVIKYNAGYGGYGPDDVPADIVQAAIEHVGFKLARKGFEQNSQSSSSVDIGDYSETPGATESIATKMLGTSIPDNVQNVIDRYRRVDL